MIDMSYTEPGFWFMRETRRARVRGQSLRLSVRWTGRLSTLNYLSEKSSTFNIVRRSVCLYSVLANHWIDASGLGKITSLAQDTWHDLRHPKFSPIFADML